MSILRLISVVLACLVAGCSRTELLYDNVDWLAHRWASRLVDANRSQRDAWREPFRQVLADHRDELLPEIVSLLRTLEQEVRQGLSAEVLHCLIDIGGRVYRDHARMAVSLATRVLLDISTRQVVHLAESLEERDREYRDKYLQDDRALRERERVGRLVERIERWTGRLDASQIAVIERSLQAIPSATEDWLAYRQAQQTRLIVLLSARPYRGTLQQFLNDWWVEHAGQSPGLRKKIEQIRDGSVELILALEGTLRAEQRAALLDNIGDLRRQLEGLIEAPALLPLARQELSACSMG